MKTAIMLLGLSLPFAFHETAMAGPALGRLPRVVDSNGRILGSLGGDTLSGALGGAPNTSPANVIRREGSTTVALQVNRFGMEVPQIFLLHTSADCSGTAYLPIGHELVRRVSVEYDADTGAPVTAYFPTSPAQTLTIRSREFVDTPVSCLANGNSPLGANRCCGAVASSDLLVAPVQQFDVSIYEPPFTVK